MEITMKNAGKNSNNRLSAFPGAFPVLLWGFCLAACLFSAVALAAQKDDTALFWHITRDGEINGYLLGTIHSEDPRVLDFPETFLELLKSNEVFAMEMVPDLPTLSRLTDYMHYQDGSTLETHVGSERYRKVMDALSRYQVPDDWKARMKVWAAVMTLSVPPPETGFFMDFSLSLRAAGSGMKVVGLETLEQQLSFLEEMPFDQQLQLLDQALVEYERVQEVHDQMVESYLSGDLTALIEEAELQLGQLDPETRAYFISQGIDARNHRMLDSLLPLLADSSVFVAVGALHLPGEQGLIALLRAQGFELRPGALPLKAAGLQAAPQGD
jgi:uncharacterized protein YbaP (TraB family)